MSAFLDLNATGSLSQAALAQRKRIQGGRDHSVKLMCNDCKEDPPNIIEDFSAGDLICGSCGLVLGNRIIDTRSEWRTFSNSEDNSGDPSRVGASSDPLLGGLNAIDSTVIGRGTGSLAGAAGYLSKAHSKTFSLRQDKHILTGFKDIQAMCERIGLQKIVSDSAKQLYKKVEDQKLLKGKSPEAIMAACIYIGCREQNATRTFKEICALTKVSKKEIGRIYKILRPTLERPTQQISLESYINRFSSALSLSQEIRLNTQIILQRVQDIGILAGKSPISVVAACLYFITSLSSETIIAKEISDVAGCTEATLKNAYKILWENKEIIGKDLSLTKSIKDLPSV